ncbi:phosphoglycerate dehydrogenase [Actinobacteria bacterium YIM 96077]|uniref:Phosphoglycerate dehydrogenase n=1 Tax=Phytoactinopolyspora halophila TaxID=1981511 RepID=A0A329R3M6_9ACTN|nr:NAD(P)-dependent oxidoreductase [Phytoactinopolyspora halophila]AYY13173.1 phosphoglycerate dehydrogenase [Actinobacteria bacterium YIM 96077]RAW17588.1 phosphoglycerate dehydrogenase [Phytoactinopolyspora halophila]
MGTDSHSYDVVVSEDVWGEPFDGLARERSVLAGADLWSDRTRLTRVLETAQALVVRNRTTVDAELIRAAPGLKVIARAGVGLENIDVQAADERGVVVVSPRGANSRSVAEYTIGSALALLRGLLPHDRAVRDGAWNRHPGRELSGRTWGILGAGSTGLAVARLARGFGMPVTGYDPYVDDDDPQLAASGVRLVSLDALCREADVISVHLPGGPETSGLVDRRLMKLMGSETILINVGRGEVVDEEALAEALENGDLAGAALDVRASEPPVPAALERLDNTLLTPHIAGITEESQDRIVHALVADIRAVLAGDEAAHAVGRARAVSGEPADGPGARP